MRRGVDEEEMQNKTVQITQRCSHTMGCVVKARAVKQVQGGVLSQPHEGIRERDKDSSTGQEQEHDRAAFVPTTTRVHLENTNYSSKKKAKRKPIISLISLQKERASSFVATFRPRPFATTARPRREGKRDLVLPLVHSGGTHARTDAHRHHTEAAAGVEKKSGGKTNVSQTLQKRGCSQEGQ